MRVWIPGIRTFMFGRYGSLLLVLFVLLVLQPTVETMIGKALLEVLFIAVLFAGLRAIELKKGLLGVEVLLLVTSLVLTVSGNLLNQEVLFIYGVIARTLFMLLVVLAILTDLFRSRRVSGDTLAGAVGIHLMIALIWGYFYLIVEVVAPGSFTFTQGAGRLQLWVAREFYPYFYFSLVTMTTVGYGDMAPVTTEARTMATLEAIVGQVYLTILVARLVGMHLAQQINKDD